MSQDKHPMLLVAAVLAASLAATGPAFAQSDPFSQSVQQFLKGSSKGSSVEGSAVGQEFYADDDDVDVLKEPRLPANEDERPQLVLTQLRRGEKVTVIGKTRDGEWYHVLVNRLEWDADKHDFKATEGWVLRQTRTPVAVAPGEPPPPPLSTPRALFVSAPPQSTPERPALPAEPVKLKPDACREKFAERLLSFLNIPYKWGGTSRRGVDCSGLVVASMLEANCVRMAPPRTAADQQRASYPVHKGQLRKGDLIFFHKKGQVKHVAVFIGDEPCPTSKHNVIEAPRTGDVVRTSELDGRIAGRDVSFGSLLPKLEGQGGKDIPTDRDNLRYPRFGPR